MRALSVVTGEEVLSAEGYARLLGDLVGLLERGRQQAERAVASVLARTYWEMGRRIEAEKLTERGGYGSRLLAQLALDLGAGERTLQRAVQFARMYADGPREGLSWTHYQQLVRVDDPTERAQLEARALGEEWSVQRLTAAVREARGLAARRLPAGGKDVLARPTDAAHVYACWVERVIDGDTLVVQLDLGFEVIRRQKLRLADVQAPEAGETARRATLFVLERMGRAQSVAIKTDTRGDPHGRYVGHVFYSPGEQGAGEVFAAGRYLNAELVEAGLAGVMRVG